jgi:hypothetical protein
MNTNPIAEVIEFIAARDPEFVNQIRGASADDLDRLERAMRRPLIEVHRQYLERMGHGSSWLKLGAAQFDVDSLIRYHEHYGTPDPDRHCMIGRTRQDPYYDIYLWSESGSEREDCHRVVSFPPPPGSGFEAFAAKHRVQIAGSLPQLIGDRAIAMFRNHKMPEHRQVEDLVGKPAARLDQLDALLLRFGISPLWYSNDWNRTYESADLLVNAFEVPGRFRLIVDVRAATQEEMDRVFPEVRRLVKAN